MTGNYRPNVLQVRILERFMSESDLDFLIEEYQEARLAPTSKGAGFSNVKYPKKYYIWLEETKSGMTVDEISRKYNIERRLVDKALQLAALQEQSRK